MSQNGAQGAIGGLPPSSLNYYTPTSLPPSSLLPSSVSGSVLAPAPPAPAPVPPPAWIGQVPAFLDSLPDMEQTIPDEIVQHLLERTGCNVQDPKLVRLVALASQHFLLDVVTDAKQLQRLRTTTGERKSDDTELTQRDLSDALQLHGINLSKPEYIADHAHAGGMLQVGQAVAVPQSNLAGKDGRKDKEKKQR